MTAIIRRTVSWLVALVTMLFTGYYLYLSSNPDVNYRSLRHFWNIMGFLSILLGLVAVGLWWLKKTMLDNKKLRPDTGLSGNTILMLRQGHMLSGWLSFVLGLGHGIYYLLDQQSRFKFAGTGIVATGIMVLLIYVGILYQYRVIKAPVLRSLHLIFSLMLAVVLLLHI